jgi:hypothetical protein
MRKENKSTTNRFFWLRNEVFPLLDAPRNDQNAAVKKPPVSIDGGLLALAGTRPRRRAHAGTVARAPPRGPCPQAPAVRPVPPRPHTPALLVHAAVPVLGRVACYAAPAHAWPRSAVPACVLALLLARPRRHSRAQQRSSVPSCQRSAVRPAPPRPPALLHAAVPVCVSVACACLLSSARPRRRARARPGGLLRCSRPCSAALIHAVVTACVLPRQRSSAPPCPRSAVRLCWRVRA